MPEDLIACQKHPRCLRETDGGTLFIYQFVGFKRKLESTRPRAALAVRLFVHVPQAQSCFNKNKQEEAERILLRLPRASFVLV